MSGTGDADNRMAPVGRSRARPGDVPDALAARYLIERDMTGRQAAFFRDHREDAPRFVDRGGSLAAGSAWPDAVRDMLEVARHRGWNSIRVQGSPAFTREVWVQARSLGLDVTGHRPTARDRQAVAGPAGRTLPEGPARRRFDEIAVVLRALVPGAADRDSLMARAREHLLGPDRDRRPRDRER